MELRRARAQLGVRETFDRAVVERAVRDAALVTRRDCETVVLRRDDHAAAAMVDHRMVRAAVPERQLERLLGGREREQLVAEADSQHRRSPEELAERLAL